MLKKIAYEKKLIFCFVTNQAKGPKSLMDQPSPPAQGPKT